MNQTAPGSKQMNDEEFMYSRFDDFYADILPSAEADRFRRLIQDPNNQEIVDQVKRAVGMFQLGLQSYFLNETQMASLHEIVEDADVRKTREMQRIDQLAKWEAFADFRKRLVIILLVAGVIFAVLYYFTPKKKMHFDPLQTLAYESLALEEKPDAKLDLPTHSNEEIASFFGAYKGLDFAPKALSKLPAEWRPDGATVIEYDADKIVAVQYTSQGKSDKLFYFNYVGSVSELPKAEPIDVNGTKFYPFKSDDFNIVSWQISERVAGMLIGRRSAKELASIVQQAL